VKNHAVAGVKSVKKNLKENLKENCKDSDSHGKDVVACTRILTPIYQPPHAVKLKASLYKDAYGFYLLEFFGEKHLFSCHHNDHHCKNTAAWVVAWANELNALSKFTFHAIKVIQSLEASITFEAATCKLIVMARSKVRLSHGEKMTKISLRLPKKSSRSSQS
jgi:hypothetical protein